MNYTHIIRELGISYEPYPSDLPGDYNWYGIYDGRYDWYDKTGFREFLLHHLIGHCFRLDVEVPETLEEAMAKHFAAPGRAFNIIHKLRGLSEAAISADSGFQLIADFVNKHICMKFGPVRKISWIGRLKDLAVEDTMFAISQRQLFHSSSAPVEENQVPAFVEFLDHMDYIADLREHYESALEMPDDKEKDKEAVIYPKNAEEILEEVKGFAILMLGHPNIIKVVKDQFPEIKNDLASMELDQMILEVKSEIKALNNPLLGSFGEYLFVHCVKSIRNEKIKKVHRDGIDYLYNDIPVDVGSARDLDQHFKVKRINRKHVHVFFFSDCCSINYPGHFDHKYDWKEVARLYSLWKKNHQVKTDKVPVRSFTKEYDEIKAEVAAFFKAKALTPRIIYRTVSRGFGLGESPDNLLPQVINKDSVTIYLDFNSFQRTRDNIRFIIAFPDVYANKIPRQQKVVLESGRENLEKADLVKIIQDQDKCYFRDLEEFFSRFFNRFPDC